MTSPVFLINTIDQTSFDEFCSRSNVVTKIKEWSFCLCLYLFYCHCVAHSKTLWINLSKCPKNTFECEFHLFQTFSKTTRKKKVGASCLNLARRKKLVRNPPIRNANIYPCNSAGYQNELLCTNSKKHYSNGLEDTWASWQYLWFIPKLHIGLRTTTAQIIGFQIW